MLTLSLTVPIADAAGWRFALAIWGALVIVAALVWWRVARALRADPAPAPSPAPSPVAEAVGDVSWWRRPVVWGLTVAFSGQAFACYGRTAWLPVLPAERVGMSAAAAGAGASIFQIAAIAGAVGVPMLLRWVAAPRVAVGVVCAAWLTLALGLLLVPSWWAVWCAIGGAAQGGGLTVIFALVVRTARDVVESRRMSALVQGGGYTVAALGPFVVGAAHQASGGWTAPLLVVLAALLVLLTAGMAASGQRARNQRAL